MGVTGTVLVQVRNELVGAIELEEPGGRVTAMPPLQESSTPSARNARGGSRHRDATAAKPRTIGPRLARTLRAGRRQIHIHRLIARAVCGSTGALVGISLLFAGAIALDLPADTARLDLATVLAAALGLVVGAATGVPADRTTRWESQWDAAAGLPSTVTTLSGLRERRTASPWADAILTNAEAAPPPLPRSTQLDRTTPRWTRTRIATLVGSAVLVVALIPLLPAPATPPRLTPSERRVLEALVDDPEQPDSVRTAASVALEDGPSAVDAVTAALEAEVATRRDRVRARLEVIEELASSSGTGALASWLSAPSTQPENAAAVRRAFDALSGDDSRRRWLESIADRLEEADDPSAAEWLRAGLDGEAAAPPTDMSALASEWRDRRALLARFRGSDAASFVDSTLAGGGDDTSNRTDASVPGSDPDSNPATDAGSPTNSEALTGFTPEVDGNGASSDTGTTLAAGFTPEWIDLISRPEIEPRWIDVVDAFRALGQKERP